jgi:hypothetical protein
LEKKTKINGPQGEVDATEVGYRTSGEFWNEYLMDDGSVVRMKVVVTNILRIDGQYDPQGQPMYVVQSSPVVAVSAPENLRKK